MPCGFDLERTVKEANIINGTNRWSSLKTVRSDEVNAVNANAYFSNPGIRTITGLEILAKIIDPIGFADLKVPLSSFAKIKV
jgi:iron complex transport system substrate-binding protein